jgi:hypothetical protein
MVSWLTLQKQPIQAYVLILFLTLCIIWARPVLIPARRGRAREASQMWGGERSCSRPRTPVGGRPLAALCWSKSKRLTVPRAKRHPGSSIPPYPLSRAAQPPSINLPPRSASCGPQGAGSVTHTSSTHARHHIPTTSWPGLFRASRSCEAQRFTQSGSPARGR